MLLTLLNNKLIQIAVIALVLFVAGFYCGYRYEKSKFDTYKLQQQVIQQTQEIKNDYLENHAKALEQGTKIDTQGQIDAVNRHYQSIIDSLRKHAGNNSNVSTASPNSSNTGSTCPDPKSSPAYLELEQRAAKTTVLFEQLKVWYNNLRKVLNDGNNSS